MANNAQINFSFEKIIKFIPLTKYKHLINKIVKKQGEEKRKKTWFL